MPFYTNSWADAYALQGESASFFSNHQAYLVALDDLQSFIDLDDAIDFWAKMGHNTRYVTTPEECLADNFSYAIIFGTNRDYGTPQLIEAILDTITSFKE